MKEKLKNKKVVYTIIGIVSVLLVALALTYAYWLLTKEQTGENVISSACLDIEITGEKNDIELGSQYPIADSEGEELTPYEFTVTNKCDSAVDYQIALETMPNDDGKETISASALKVMLDASDAKTLDKYISIDATLTDATASNKLGSGTLAASGSTGSSATHKLRIWIDANAPIGEMNRTFTGKVSVTIGQGIVNPYKEGTMAYDVLENYGGVDEITKANSETIKDPGYEVKTEKTCTDINEEWQAYPVCGLASDKAVTLYSSYEFDEDGNITFSGKIADTNLAECKAGTYDCENNYIPGNEMDIYYYNNGIEIESKNIAVQIKDVSQIPDEDPGCMIEEFKVQIYAKHCATTSETKYRTAGTGVHKADDDLGTSYYFRGEVENNYVKFGKWADDSDTNAGKDMYWRIVRVNGDGSIRLIYDGVEKVKNGVAHDATIGNSAYYSWDSNLNYPGYMYGSESDPYGNENDSEIKTALDTWYANNLEETYGKYVADSIFCNDREISSADDWGARFKSSDRLLGGDLAPTLSCSQKADRFTVSNNLGNEALSKPVGLITADEMVLAGLPGVYTSDGMDYAYNNTFYLANGGEYWTMTPNSYHPSADMTATQAFFVSNNWNGSGNTNLIEADMYIDGLAASRGIRPVINLRADVEFTGTGEFDSPYDVVMN